jgi:hypothetical protein
MSAQEEFWKWFIQNQEELLDFEADQERIFDSLAAELRKVDPHLTFEFGPKETKREFVISAGGIKGSFPAVASLVNAAPKLPRWQVTAFRPRRTPLNVIEFRGKQARPEEVQFSLLDNGKIAGIRLFIPSFREDDADWKQIGYLLLDDALGEYDVESRVGLLKMYSPDASTTERRYPFVDLPQAFDQLVSQLEPRKPS